MKYEQDCKFVKRLWQSQSVMKACLASSVSRAWNHKKYYEYTIWVSNTMHLLLGTGKLYICVYMCVCTYVSVSNWFSLLAMKMAYI